MSIVSGLLDDAGDAANDLANKIGVPGSNSFNATPYQTDPTAFKNPYLTANAKTLGSQKNLEHQAAGIGPNAGYNAAQAGYGSLAGRLEGVANGTAPTISQNVLAQNVATNNANAMGMAATNAGQNPALAARMGLNQMGANNMNAASTAASAGIAERNAANAALGNVYGAQGQLGIGEGGMENTARANLTGMAMGAQQNAMQAQENEQALNSGNYNTAMGINAGVAAQNAQNNGNLFGGIMGAGGSVLSKAGVHLAAGGVTGDALSGIGDAMSAFTAGYRGIPESDPSKKEGSPTTQPSAASVMPLFGMGGGAAAGAGSGAGLSAILPLASEGTVVPGVDRGVDTRAYMLRPNEVVTPPENPIHPYAKAAARDPAYAAALARALKNVLTGDLGGVHGNGAPVSAGVGG